MHVVLDPADGDFFARYAWCLNPILTLADQLRRLDEELRASRDAAPGWRAEEYAINVYLLASAIACTVDDYLGPRGWDPSRMTARFPRLRGALPLLGVLGRLPLDLTPDVGDFRIRRWRAAWTRCVDLASEILAGAAAVERWTELRTTAARLIRAPLPGRLLKRRLRLPEGFRNQDLSHPDVFRLAQRFAERHQNWSGALAIVGVRTAGAYFAPLVKAYLGRLGWAPISWLTVRPRQGLSAAERRELRALGRRGIPVLVIDDNPNTGRTHALLLDALAQCGIAPDRLTILVPRHPVRPDWTLPPDAPGAGRVEVVTLEPEETHKAQLLTPAGVEPVLREWLGAQGFPRVAIRPNLAVDALNARLVAHYPDGFQVRAKRVYEVEVAGDAERPRVIHVIAKSVGWGWFGYHAYLAGTRLTGFVPRVIGLRHGLLFAEWVGPLTGSADGAPAEMSATTLARYVARRTERLALSEDPWLDGGGAGWNGWERLLSLLRHAYGAFVGRAKVAALRRALYRFASPTPTLVDGRMRPEEWLWTPEATYKLDYEQHNFGQADLGIVDPAYDLASAIFEFGLGPAAERELVQAYGQETGDRSIADRVLLYKLLTGSIALEQGAYWAPRARDRETALGWHARYLAARNFLTYEVHQLAANWLATRRSLGWSGPLVFLDVDGVFDCEALGFPHTTPSGLAALDQLRAAGYAIVLNTGRSVEHVHRYCQIYGLPGGVAEYGSVFVDAVSARARALATPAGLAALERCRQALSALPGVFVDPDYRYSVRAYRYQDGRTVGLPAAELEALLARSDFQGLEGMAMAADSYVLERGLTKGTAILAVKRELGRPETAVVAIGDSDQDVPMLEAADRWYAPANSSNRVRALASASSGRITARARQRGFLEAVTDLLRARGVAPAALPSLARPRRVSTVADLLLSVLHAAERGGAARWLAATLWQRL